MKPLTADSLTDAVIEQLRDTVDSAEVAEWCRWALHSRTSSPTRAAYRRLIANYLGAIAHQGVKP